MNSNELENLARIGKLKRESPLERELLGLRESAIARLRDASNPRLSYDSRFDLAYNAAHSLALLALRRLGYRSEHRYLVFQVLPHTLDLSPELWRVLVKSHERRNLAEYEGHLERDVPLLDALLVSTSALLQPVEGLPTASQS